MARPSHLAAVALAASSSIAVAAADLLPLKQGIYVPAGRACRGASNADMVTYWGGRSSIGAAQATCTITRLSKRGNVYTIADRCKDVQFGQSMGAGHSVLTITALTTFTRDGTRYRYCGPRALF